MKLRDGFLLREIDGETILVSVGEMSKKFNGMVRNNETAGFILKQLLKDTTEAEIVAALVAEYDVAQDEASCDVHAVLEKIKEAGILDEKDQL